MFKLKNKIKIIKLKFFFNFKNFLLNILKQKNNNLLKRK